MIHKNQKQFDKSPENEKNSETEIVITPEQKQIMESAVAYAKFLTERWPQVDEGEEPNQEQQEREPKINYYFSGSLATMLLAKARGFTELDPSRLPDIAEGKIKELPLPVRKILASFARPIGDLDYVPTPYYNEKKEKLQKSDRELANKKFLSKGGNGPVYEELPESAVAAIKPDPGHQKIQCDPVKTYSELSIAKIQVAGQDFYVATPSSALAYKVLNLLEAYDQKPEKFNADFGKLLAAVKEIYSEEEIEAAINQVLVGYEKAIKSVHDLFQADMPTPEPYQERIPAMIKKILNDPRLSPEIKATLEKL